ncbi:MAG: glycerol-3-phosphate 1-O-acyltransferase PlsY [Bacteroidales bacterium]|nr:glycerol-3-phosphate 1-O-acyltransferase PlsY [Bacteroidales bacterium]MBK8884463.1 glycerol-3-phosphate 1-O-acyltransferase PlsY [Bacteroidales bacterium]
MNVADIIIAFVIAYMLGSIPASVWIGKMVHGIDVREHGSGNAGTANTIRVLGWKTGIPVLIIDLAKGWTAAMLPVFFHIAEPGSALLTNMQILTGVTAIVGHIFPVFAGFRGGKGVATVFGVLLAIQPLLTICCLGVFLTVILLTGIVSVSSMSAGIAFPVLLFLFFDTPSVIFKIFSVLVAVALLITHRKNIRRLLKGEESRLIRFGRKKEKQE